MKLENFYHSDCLHLHYPIPKVLADAFFGLLHVFFCKIRDPIWNYELYFNLGSRLLNLANF